MKILFHLNNPYGLGADRWVVLGYKDAFEDGGHAFDFFTEKDDLGQKMSQASPDIFFTNIAVVHQDRRAISILQEAQKRGTKVFCNIGEDFREHMQVLRTLVDAGVVNTFYCTYARELMKGFTEEVSPHLVFIPLAANKKLHFPVPTDPRFQADISFLGARLATKEHLFKSILLPLAKRYRVAIYGPGWTMKDKFLRLLSGVGRRSRFFALSDWANKKRLSVSLEDERAIYSSSKICINIHEYYPDGRCKNLSNEREFKVPACGGFQLSDDVLGLGRFFVPDREIVIARSVDDWFGHVEYYMTHEEDREQIRRAGTTRALADHTYHNRVAQVLQIYATL